MDGRRRAEDLTALEREIEAALAVDPSPEFVAKIRARVANEPAPASWWQLRWRVLATAAAAAVIAIAVAVTWQPSAPEPIATRGGTDVVLPTPIPGLPVSAVRTAAPRAPRVRSAVALESEVLISRDERRGLELLLTAVRDGRINSTLASQLVAPDAATDATDIALSDIVIQPLQQLAALEGEGQ